MTKVAGRAHQQRSLLLRPVSRRGIGIVGVLVVAVALSGCSSATDAEEEPAVESFAELNYRLARDAVACMHERGWVDHQAWPDGGVSFGPYGLPEHLEAAERLDWDECWAIHGMPFQPGWTGVPEEAASAYFDDQLATAECLADLGFTVPEAPSRAAFVDAVVNNEEHWQPLVAFLDGGGPAMTWSEVTERCGHPSVFDHM